MSRHLQHKVRDRLATAIAVLDLPLSDKQTDDLAVELTPVIKAMLAQADATVAELEPVPYTVPADGTSTDTAAETEVTEYAGCTSRIGLDVDLDSAAAVLAQKLGASQPDVTATDVPDPATLGLTVRPEALEDWRWWLHRLNVAIDSVRTHGDAVTATGHYRGVTIQLRGYGVPALLQDKAAARLAGVIGGHPW
ncbi:hypothetical protein [Streptomyces sp. NPDC002845]